MKIRTGGTEGRFGAQVSKRSAEEPEVRSPEKVSKKTQRKGEEYPQRTGGDATPYERASDYLSFRYAARKIMTPTTRKPKATLPTGSSHEGREGREEEEGVVTRQELPPEGGALIPNINISMTPRTASARPMIASLCSFLLNEYLLWPFAYIRLNQRGCWSSPDWRVLSIF